jgi:hypothetical protein
LAISALGLASFFLKIENGAFQKVLTVIIFQPNTEYHKELGPLEMSQDGLVNGGLLRRVVHVVIVVLLWDVKKNRIVPRLEIGLVIWIRAFSDHFRSTNLAQIHQKNFLSLHHHLY